MRLRRCGVPGQYWVSYTRQATVNCSPKMHPADFHIPPGGRGIDTPLSAILANSSSTMRKSSPLGCPELKAPGTFSHAAYRGRILWSVRPCRSSSHLISFMIRICSINSPERSPAKPRRAPATDKSWQGEPPVITSTGGSVAPFNCVMSPTWSISGKRCFVTEIGKASISLAHTGVMPCRTAARGNPPIPSKRLPSVGIFVTALPLFHFLAEFLFLAANFRHEFSVDCVFKILLLLYIIALYHARQMIEECAGARRSSVQML